MGASFFSTIFSPLARLLKVRSTANMVEPVFIKAVERCVAMKVWYGQCYLNLLYSSLYRKYLFFDQNLPGNQICLFN